MVCTHSLAIPMRFQPFWGTQSLLAQHFREAVQPSTLEYDVGQRFHEKSKTAGPTARMPRRSTGRRAVGKPVDKAHETTR